MAVHVLIDGYNLIRRSATLRAEEDLALELGRNALLESLRQYKRTRGHRITVVFDSASKPILAEEQTQQKGIRVIYPGQGDTADSVIKRICRSEGNKVLVVTSDLELARYAEAHGSVAMGSGEFQAKMEMARYLNSKGEEEDEKEGWHPSKGTRKKGPAKRLSKKERRRLEKWRKV